MGGDEGYRRDSCQFAAVLQPALQHSASAGLSAFQSAAAAISRLTGAGFGSKFNADPQRPERHSARNELREFAQVLANQGRPSAHAASSQCAQILPTLAKNSFECLVAGTPQPHLH